MKAALARIKKNTFIRHNLIFLGGSIAVGGLNYLFYPIVGRLLSPSAFGEVQVLVSLFLQLTIFLTVLSLVTVNITVNYQHQQERNDIIYELEKVALIISLAILLIALVGGELFKRFLHFDSTVPFALLAVALVITVPFTFRSGFLRGQQAFAKTAVANLISAGGKLVLAVILVAAGFGTNGAIAGLVGAQLLAFGYSRWQASRSGLVRADSRTRWSMPRFGLIAPELRYSLFVFIGSLAVMMLFSIDVVVVKHFFDSHVAGLYAGIATVARIIFFVTASVAQVMLSAVKIDQPPAQNRRLLIKSGLLLAGLSLLPLLAFWLAPELIIRMLMGSDYLTYAQLLPQLGMAIFVISIINLVVSYALALRQYGPGIVTMFGTIITSVIMVSNHHSLDAIVSSLLYGSIGIVSVIFGWAAYQRFKRGDSDQTVNFDHRPNP